MTEITLKERSSHLLSDISQEQKTSIINKIKYELDAQDNYEERCKMFRLVSETLEREKDVQSYVRKILISYFASDNAIHTCDLIEYPETFDHEHIPADFNAGACLPKILADYLMAAAANIQVKPEMLALPCISVLASCVQGKANVSTNGEHKEELSIYTMTIAPPAERKTASLNVFMNAVNKYRVEKNRRKKRVIAEAEAEIEALKVQIAKYKSGRSNAGTEQTFKENLLKLKELEETKPHYTQMPLTDVTPEAIIKEMEAYNGRACIISDECGILDIMDGMYSKSGASNIDVLLQGDSGQALKKKRATGEEITIEKPLLTIGTMGQPDKFHDLISNSKMNGRGLTARFAYAFPDSLIGKQKMIGEKLPEEIKEEYAGLIKKLMDIPYPSGSDEIPTLIFDKEAYILADNYFDSIQKELLNGEFSSGFAKEFGGKQFGRFMKIAGILHLCSYSVNDKITGDTVQKAIAFSNWIIDQAKKVFNDTATENGEERRLIELLKKLKKSCQPESIIKKRTIIQNNKNRGFYRMEKCSELINADIEELQSRYFLFDAIPNSAEPAKKATEFKLNPFIYTIKL